MQYTQSRVGSNSNIGEAGDPSCQNFVTLVYSFYANHVDLVPAVCGTVICSFRGGRGLLQAYTVLDGAH
jgi:ribosomal protein S27E